MIGASCIGACKRSVSFPFVFGDKALRKRHRGMVISERRLRVVYSAVKSYQGKQEEKFGLLCTERVLKEIATVYRNDESTFGAQKFCVIPKRGLQ